MSKNPFHPDKIKLMGGKKERIDSERINVLHTTVIATTTAKMIGKKVCQVPLSQFFLSNMPLKIYSILSLYIHTYIGFTHLINLRNIN